MLNRSGLNAIRGSIGMGQGNIRNQNTRSDDMFYNNSPYAKSGNAPTSPYKPDYASGGGLNQNPGGTQQGGMQNPEGFTQQQQPWTATTWMNPGNRPQDSQSGGGWNPNGFNGFIGAGSNAPYNGPVGGGFQQQGGMQNPEGFTQQQNPWAPANWMNPGNRPQDSQSGGGWNPNGFNGFIGAGSNAPYNGPIGGGFSPNKGPEMPPTVNPGQPGQATNAPNPSVPAGPTMPQFVMGGANNPAVNLNGRDNPRRFMQRPSLSPQQMQQLRTPYRPQAPSDDTAYTPPIYIQPDM